MGMADSQLCMAAGTIRQVDSVTVDVERVQFILVANEVKRENYVVVLFTHQYWGNDSRSPSELLFAQEVIRDKSFEDLCTFCVQQEFP